MNESNRSTTGAPIGTAAEGPPPSPKPPRGPHVVTLLAAGALILSLLAGAVWFGARFGDRLGAGAREALHDLEHDHGAHAHGEDGEGDWYTCGMHPWVVLPDPGLCPICQMELTPLDTAKFGGEITIDPVVTQNIGVRIAPVVAGPLRRTVRTVGQVDFDERRVRDVHVKVDGWIEELHVDWVGAGVERGQPLFELYSRELYAAQEQFLLALRAARARDGSDSGILPGFEDDAARALEAARTRLRLFDIADAQIDALAESGTPARTMTIVSPHAGVVTEKHVFEGMRVEPQRPLYRIADLSHVWVMATVYEHQLPFVAEGREAIVTLDYLPGRRFEATVGHVYPWVDERTREVRVRLELDNDAALLRPGMFATVEFGTTIAESATLAPRAAVLDTGERQVAFVSLGAGRFEPREVATGIEAEGGMLEIRSGLAPGEMVVVSGQFLLDSESRMREALLRMVEGTPASDQAVVAEAAADGELRAMPDAMADRLAELFDVYEDVSAALAGDTLDGVAPAAARLAETAEALIGTEVPGDPHFWHRHAEVQELPELARAIAATPELETVRVRFKAFNDVLLPLVRKSGVPPELSELQAFQCDMYRSAEGGGQWLQRGGHPANPYYGSEMPACYTDSWKPAVVPVDGDAREAAERGTDPERREPAESPDHGETEARAGEPREATAPDARGREAAEDGASLDAVFTEYLALHELLAADRVTGADRHAAALADAAERLAASGDARLHAAGTALRTALARAATDLAGWRATFRALSDVLVPLVAERPPTAAVAPVLREVWCPMAEAAWLQRADVVQNPFHGSEMPTCGSIRAAFELPARRGER